MPVAIDLCLRRRDDTTSNRSGDEIKESVFQIEHNKAPGPDGFSAEFYLVFWEIIKEDLLILFSDFYEESLPLFSLNFGVITCFQRYKIPNRYNNIDQYVYSMSASRFS
jgi:hypothetical protein